MLRGDKKRALRGDCLTRQSSLDPAQLQQKPSKLRPLYQNPILDSRSCDPCLPWSLPFRPDSRKEARPAFFLGGPSLSGPVEERGPRAQGEKWDGTSFVYLGNLPRGRTRTSGNM